ncbi:unnamed protein product [Cyprideis torosa]|uniref:Uncharacterized protein n=1 Tax=Cyprideis torosa TaxID=163714 RepID=A0A7R8WD15_9CRUS|nr:unnamed protein product [Cyprideis torosa]CAG0888477.1 unnamed protein product [Cyprideis torosa]
MRRLAFKKAQYMRRLAFKKAQYMRRLAFKKAQYMMRTYLEFVRGGLLIIGTWCSVPPDPEYSPLESLTMTLSVFQHVTDHVPGVSEVIFNGGLTNSVLHWLDIKCGQDDPEQRAFANLRDRSATSYQSVGGSTAVGRKVIFNGGLTNSVLHWLDIKCGQDDPEQRAFANLRDRSATSYQSVGGSTAVGRKDSPWTPGSASAVAEGAADPPPNAPTKSVMARQWGHIDTLFLKPLLTHARPTLLDTMPVCCQPIARFFTTTRQLTQLHEIGNESVSTQLSHGTPGPSTVTTGAAPSPSSLPINAVSRLHEIGKESVSTQLSHGTPGPSTVTTGAAPSPSSLPINAVSRPPGEGLDSLLAENHLIAGTPTDDLPLSTYPSPSSSQDAKPLQP